MDIASCFRMPLYFILSGLFFKDYGGFKYFMVKKTNKLAIPWLFFFVLNIIFFPFLLCGLFPTLYEKPVVGTNYFFCFYFEKSNNMPSAIWFLLCLFILNFIFYVIFMISKRFATFYNEGNPSKNFISALILLSISLGGVGYYLGVSHINLYMHLDSALTVVPFFCFGYMLRKYTNLLYPNRYDKYNFLFIIISFVMIYMLGHFKISYRNNVYHVPLLSLYFTGMAGSLAILFIAKYIKKMPIVSYIGRYSIIVLCTHEQIIYLMKSFFDVTKTDLSMFVRCIIIFITIIVLEVTIIIPFMIKFMPHVTAQKDIIILKQ